MKILLLMVCAVWLHAIPEITARGCGSTGLRLRSTEPQIDLSGLSPWQLQKLAQQLAKLQGGKGEANEDEDRDEDEYEDQNEDRNEDEDQNQVKPQLEDDYENDHRGSSRPWNRVQRIIRRQLVKIPKRYLRKILRQFGLARSLEGLPQPELKEYYLIPLE